MRPIAFTAALGVLMAVSSAAGAQPAPDAGMPVINTPSPSQSTLTLQQLQKLVAPIALYPDQVLTDILAAATYPAQVVEAQRFAADPAHAGLTGEALADAAAAQDWDPSVQALLMFPQVLQMMDGNLDWTEHLGRAFIAQQADLMNAVQQLRLAAEQSGTLASGPYATVVNEGGDIAIDPPSQQTIYLPGYQPDCVFGPNPACDGLDTVVDWSGGIFLPYGYAQWGSVDWRRRDIRLAQFGEGGGAARFGNGGAPGLGPVWRHANLRVAGGGELTGNPGQFTYAPPVHMPAPAGFSSDGRSNSGFVRQPAPAQRPRFNTAPVFRPAPAAHAVGAPRLAPVTGHH